MIGSEGVTFVDSLLQRSSISPAEREKYRPRSPPDTHELKKVKKEEKDGHVSERVSLL